MGTWLEPSKLRLEGHALLDELRLEKAHNPPSLILRHDRRGSEADCGEAPALPQKARARLAHQLLESLIPPEENLSRKEWKQAWKNELEKRAEDMCTGKVKGIPPSQVMAALRAKYG